MIPTRGCNPVCPGEHSHWEAWWHRLVVTVTQCHGRRGERCSPHALQQVWSQQLLQDPG